MARVLIVEDDPDIAMSLGADLRRQGHQSEVVTDGERAVEVGTSGQWDLILLDVMLPDGNGYSFCKQLRDAGQYVPVIMLTARSAAEERVRGLDAIQQLVDARLQAVVLVHQGVADQHPGQAAILLGETEQQGGGGANGRQQHLASLQFEQHRVQGVAQQTCELL